MFDRYRFLIVITLSLCAFSSKAGETSNPSLTVELSGSKAGENAGSTLIQLPPEVTDKIVSLLNLQDLGPLALCSKLCRAMVDSSRKASQFAVTVTDNNGERRTYFLEEYLSQPGRIPISEAKNLDILAKQRPKDFMELVIASIANTPALRESSLKSFYEKMFPIAQLIASLPSLETPQEKLAGILIELSFWCQVWEQVWKQVWEQVWKQIGTQVWQQVGEQVWEQVWNQVRDQVWDQLYNDLRNFDMSLAYQQGQLSERLRLAIDYVLAVYQLGTIAMRHSEAFKQIHEALADRLLQRMTSEQIQHVVDSIVIPPTPPNPNNYLVQTQLDILRRRLGMD